MSRVRSTFDVTLRTGHHGTPHAASRRAARRPARHLAARPAPPLIRGRLAFAHPRIRFPSGRAPCITHRTPEPTLAATRRVGRRRPGLFTLSRIDPRVLRQCRTYFAPSLSNA
ncbi:conserved hypothetical protein [Burkholderia pseudomallei MSHR346]|nr:conserved hypothetical protein [Burkholderia pseudomallei MSHR346]